MAQSDPTQNKPAGDETRAAARPAIDQFEMTSDDAWAVAMCVRGCATETAARWDRDSDPLGCPVVQQTR